MNNNKLLFVTWDGADVTYVENLFAPIFIELRRIYGVEVHVFQFSSATADRLEQRKSHLRNLGLIYSYISVNDKIPSVFNLLKARYWDTSYLKSYIQEHKIGTIMPRAVNSFFIIQVLTKEMGLKLIYDADGFPMEERVEYAGLSRTSLRYRFFSRLEYLAYNISSAIICRTNVAKTIIHERSDAAFDLDKVFVVNNGTLTQQTVPARGRAEVCRLVYAGSFGPQYMFGEMLDVFNALKAEVESATLTLLTFQTAKVWEIINDLYPHLSGSVEILSLAPQDVHIQLAASDFGFSFRKPSFAMKGVSPIKIPEYLNAGLNLIYNRGIGDLDELLDGKDFAFVFETFDKTELALFVNWVKERMHTPGKELVQEFAISNFALADTAKQYWNAWNYGKGQ